MTTHTTTLADFLLARIAEDEADARYLMVGLPPATGGPYSVDHPARVLAECEAKRRIVELHGVDDPTGRLYPGAPLACRVCDHDGSDRVYPCDTLRTLAAVYADHPDYGESWRP